MSYDHLLLYNCYSSENCNSISYDKNGYCGKCEKNNKSLMENYECSKNHIQENIRIMLIKNKETFGKLNKVKYVFEVYDLYLRNLCFIFITTSLTDVVIKKCIEFVHDSNDILHEFIENNKEYDFVGDFIRTIAESFETDFLANEQMSEQALKKFETVVVKFMDEHIKNKLSNIEQTEQSSDNSIQTYNKQYYICCDTIQLNL